MKKYEARAMMRSSLYFSFFKKWDKTTQNQVLRRIKELIEEEKDYCDNGNYLHLSDIFAAIALYEVLQKQGMSEEDTFSELSKELYLAVQRRKKIMQKLLKIKGVWHILKMVLPYSFRYGSGTGWRFTWFREHPKNEYSFEVNACIYQKIFQKRKVEKLGPMFCKCDIIMYGFLPGIDFQRKGTLCYGDDRCDFRFVKYPKGRAFQRSKSR